MTSVRVVGPGRAGRSLMRALGGVGWDLRSPLRRQDDPVAAADGVDLLVIATPDAAVREVADAIRPDGTTLVAHLSGSLGLGVLGAHPRRAVLHPLMALPDPERGAARLHGGWFGLAVDGDPMADDVVAALGGRSVRIAEADWARYHAAACISANHLVALMGHVERVADGIGVPLEALLDLARGSLEDVAALGPAAALTGPVRRGDAATVAAHVAALPPEERPAYEALSKEAARLCP